MKTQFLRKSRRYIAPTAAVKFAAAVLVLLIVALWRILFPNAFLTTFAPLSRIGTSLSGSVGGFSALWADKAALSREKDRLAASLAQMTEERDKLSAQVADLTRHEGTRTSLPSGILTSVLIRPPIAAYDSVVTDAGSESGIAVGNLALSDGGTPVGLVSSVTARFSHVTLFSSSGVETPVLVGAARLPGVLKGEGAGSFSVELSKPTSNASGAAVGDMVYVSYNGASPVGVVRSIATSPSSVTETLLVSGNVSPFSLVWLSVVPYAH